MASSIRVQKKIADKRRRLIFPDAGKGTVDRGDTVMTPKKEGDGGLPAFLIKAPIKRQKCLVVEE